MTLVDGRQLLQRLEQYHPILLEKLKSPFCAVVSAGNGKTPFPIFSISKSGNFTLRFRGDGDMSFDRLTSVERKTLFQTINDLTSLLPVGISEAVLLNNHVRLHGRTSLHGHRELWRLLIEEN